MADLILLQLEYYLLIVICSHVKYFVPLSLIMECPHDGSYMLPLWLVIEICCKRLYDTRITPHTLVKTVSEFHCPSPFSLGGVCKQPLIKLKRFSFM